MLKHMKREIGDGVYTKIFGVPITKTLDKSEDGFLVVQGKFTSDQKDMAGDIITRGATERALPDYREWGNIRYMHQPKPVGKVIAIGEEDGLEWNEVRIKVIDPVASFEVENELLTALSVGILIMWEDLEFLEDGGWIINDYSLAEISLVDHPANYDAKLDFGAMTKDFVKCVGDDGLMCAMKTHGLLRGTPSIEKSPACRQEDESVEDCVDRKIPEILEDEDVDQDQAVAIAHDMCEEACEDKTLESTQLGEEEINMSKNTDETIVVETVEEEEAATPEELVEEKDLVTEEEVGEEVEGDPTELDKEITSEDAEEEAEAVAEEIEQDEPEPIEDTEDVVADPIAELSTSINELKTMLSDAFERMQEVPAEAPEEQVEDEAPTEVDPEVVRLQGEVDALKKEMDELLELLHTYTAPANRQAPVLSPEEGDEEVAEEVVRDVEPTTLRGAVQRYIESNM